MKRRIATCQQKSNLLDPSMWNRSAVCRANRSLASTKSWWSLMSTSTSLFLARTPTKLMATSSRTCRLKIRRLNRTARQSILSLSLSGTLRVAVRRTPITSLEWTTNQRNLQPTPKERDSLPSFHCLKTLRLVCERGSYRQLWTLPWMETRFFTMRVA